jgi:hypothetical protein
LRVKAGKEDRDGAGDGRARGRVGRAL